jgi:transposase-like protein
VLRQRRRSFTRDFKLSVLKRMAETDNIAVLAAELGIQRKQLYCWRDAYQDGGTAGLRRAGRPSRQDRTEAALAVPTVVPTPADPARRIAELERKIGEQQLALDFFRKALRHAREQRQRKGAPGGMASTP